MTETTLIFPTPGCIGAGPTLNELKQLIREGIEQHSRGMREAGLPIAEPGLVEYVDAA